MPETPINWTMDYVEEMLTVNDYTDTEGWKLEGCNWYSINKQIEHSCIYPSVWCVYMCDTCSMVSVKKSMSKGECERNISTCTPLKRQNRTFFCLDLVKVHRLYNIVTKYKHILKLKSHMTWQWVQSNMLHLNALKTL